MVVSDRAPISCPLGRLSEPRMRIVCGLARVGHLELVANRMEPAQAVREIGQVDEQADRGGGGHGHHDQERSRDEPRPHPARRRALPVRRRLAAGGWLSARGLRRDRRIGDLGRRARRPGRRLRGDGTLGGRRDALLGGVLGGSRPKPLHRSLAGSLAIREGRGVRLDRVLDHGVGLGCGPVGGLGGLVGARARSRRDRRLAGPPLRSPASTAGARWRPGRRGVAFARPAIGVGRRPGLPPFGSPVPSGRSAPSTGVNPRPRRARVGGQRVRSSWTKLTTERR